MINHLLYYALIPQFITGNASSLHYSQWFVLRGTQQLNGLLLIYIRLTQNCCVAATLKSVLTNHVTLINVCIMWTRQCTIIMSTYLPIWSQNHRCCGVWEESREVGMTSLSLFNLRCEYISTLSAQLTTRCIAIKGHKIMIIPSDW